MKIYQIKTLEGKLIFETTDNLAFIKKQISLNQSGQIYYLVVIKRNDLLK